MGASVDYLQRDRKTGRLSFRRVFPTELRPFIPGNIVELKRSLRSRTVNDDAATLYTQAAEEYDRLLGLAVKQASGSFDTLDDPIIAYLAEAYRVEALALDDEARWDEGERELVAAIAAQDGVYVNYDGQPSTRWALKTRESLEAAEAHYRSLLAAGDTSGIVELTGWEIDQFAQAQGYRLDISSPSFRVLCRSVAQRALQAITERLSRLDGVHVETPNAPQLVPARSSISSTAASTVPLLDIYDGYASSQGLTPGVRREFRGFVQNLIAVRRQNIRHNSRRKLAEWGLRQGCDVKRRACGEASADVRWSFV